ncbi:DEAD/DEAH box helicase [Puniceicoccaceae bacterium K14]|nr:DEAD/DEAH box helicase [Puniceicoccaceae bacterium K14]
MQWKNANRLYSKTSLELWSKRLELSWEANFCSEALSLGRRYYKKGTVKEISIGESDAITTCRFGKEERYSVVEWEEGDLSVRSSTNDDICAGAMAVAGLLEIEELIADEDLALLEDFKMEVQQPKESPTHFKKKNRIKTPSRILHLVLDTHYKGLICEAYWVSEDGIRNPALRIDTGAPNAESAEERGRLIALATKARKSHFKYSAEFNGYLLENLHEIPFFIHRVWPSWKAVFSWEERENVSNIRETVTMLKVQARADVTDTGKLDLDWVFRTGQGLLGEEATNRLLESGGKPSLVPELGIVQVDAESRKMMEEWRQKEESEEVLAFEPYHLFSLFPADSQNLILSEEIEKWRNRLLSPDQEKIDLLECLRPYQRYGVKWMARLLDNECNCLLADEMGLGKTVQVIAYVKERILEKCSVVILCPASVVPVWISEFKKFAPQKKAVKYEGGPIKKLGEDWDVMVTSFSQMRNHIDKLEVHPFELAIIDEAQFIKNPTAKITQSTFRIKAPKRIALTGTPIENKPLDIWPAFRFLMPGLLGTKKDFESRFAENPGAFKARLKTQIEPFMLRRTKAEVAKDLPEKIIIDHHCDLTKKQVDEYSRLCSEGMERLSNDKGKAMNKNRFAIFSLLTRLRQVSCDPDLLPWMEAKLEDSGKLMMLLEKLIEVLGTGHKVVIFSQFTGFLARVNEMIRESFPGLPIFQLTGSTKDREVPVNGFQQCEETAAMLVSLKAAGTGITLHSADYVFVLDPWWNPAVENQAIDRVHRIGQKKTVFVYRFIAKRSIEERIQNLQGEKMELFNSLISDSKTEGAEFSSQMKSLEALLVLAQEDH